MVSYALEVKKCGDIFLLFNEANMGDVPIQIKVKAEWNEEKEKKKK
jgi:hypothetical protein